MLTNIHSGKGVIGEQLTTIINYYNKQGFETTVYISQYPKHIKEIIQNNGDKYDNIICSGGDGSLNEAVNGLLTLKTKPIFGYIPSGSTNDFANSLGIPLNIEDSYKTAIHGKPFNLDIGKINNKYFTYVAGFGLFTNISYETPQNFKNILGYQAYLLEGIKQLSNIEKYRLNITYDNNNVIADDIIIGLVSNSNSIAGMTKIFENYAQLNDGLFEILLVKYPKNVYVLKNIINCIVEKSFDNELFYSFKAHTINIQSQRNIKWTIDGEYCGSYNEANINVINQAISINC